MSTFPIVTGTELGAEVLDLWEHGAPRGESTGWPCVDELYTVMPRQLTLVTGIPGSGKSEWLDALAINLARGGNWQFAVYSPENFPVAEHAAKLAEKYLGKPFARGPTPRMQRDEVEEALVWITEHFRWLRPSYTDPMSLLATAIDWRTTITRKFGVILDPWNTLEHGKQPGQTEAEYVSATLTAVINACRSEDFHCWLVAHPRVIERLKDGKRPVPTPYDVSGGANFYNKSDNIICIHRDQAEGSPDVEIHVQKVRFKRAGRVGLTTLSYDRITGRYADTSAADHYREAAGK